MTAIPVLTAEVAAHSDERLRPRGKASYVAGLTDEPLRFATLSQVFDEAVADFGSRPAAIFSSLRQVLTWSDLKRDSEQVALSLMALGLQRGDKVGIWSPNRREWLSALFGAARIGVVLVSLDPACKLVELEASLNKLECRALIMVRSADGSDLMGMLRGLAPELDRPAAKPLLEAQRLPHLKHVIVLDEGLVPACARRFSDFLRLGGASQRRRLPAAVASLDPDDAISIQFTSGTTGPAKAVTLSHYSIVNNAHCSAQALGLTEVDKLCIAVPLCQCIGLLQGVLACVSVGATMVFPAERFDALGTLDAVSRHRCTALHGVPAMFAAMLSHPDRRHYDTSCLRTGIIAGAKCHAEIITGVMEDFQMDQVTVAYGLAETGSLAFQSSVDDPLQRRVGTVGRIHSHLEAKIIDGDGQIVPVGSQGQLCTRGYSVMRDYCEDAKRTREALDTNGWLHTGDLATIDAEGYCRILGRVGDSFLRGDEKVHPHEIEAIIERHPDVRAAQVFGVPDSELGADICAWIVLEPGKALSPEEIVSFCRKHGARGRLPRHVRLVAEFPLTVNGKAKKHLMRAAMVRELAHHGVRRRA